MIDEADSAVVTPRNAPPANPHADIERAASAAIGRPVRVTERVDGVVALVAPHDTTKHGLDAIRRAVVGHLGPLMPSERVVAVVSLDDPPPAA